MIDPTWAIVAATFLGPVAAVLITRWQDRRERERDRQAATFRTLMGTRIAATSNEHVNALNMVEVDFHNMPGVTAAWKNYVQHLNRHTTEAEAIPWEETRRDLLAVLLSKMAKALGITKSEIEVRSGGYSPMAWATREQRQTQAQDWILQLAAETRALPIKIVDDQRPRKDT